MHGSREKKVATSEHGLLGKVHEHVVLEEFPSPYIRTFTVSAPYKGTVQPSVVAAIVNSRYIGLDIHCHLHSKDMDNPVSTLSALPSNPAANPTCLKPNSIADQHGGVASRQRQKTSVHPWSENLVSETTKSTAPTLTHQPRDAAVQPHSATVTRGNASSVTDPNVPLKLPFKKQRIQGAGSMPLQRVPCDPQCQVDNTSVAALSPSNMQTLPHLSGAPCSLGLSRGAKKTTSTGLALGVTPHPVTVKTNIVNPPMDIRMNAVAAGTPVLQSSRAADFFKILQQRREALGSTSRKRELVPHLAEVIPFGSMLGICECFFSYPLLLIACAHLQ